MQIQNTQDKITKSLRESLEHNSKNENMGSSTHFHSFRAWFKTQVTDAHKSDFDKALMGHKSPTTIV